LYRALRAPTRSASPAPWPPEPCPALGSCAPWATLAPLALRAALRALRALVSPRGALRTSQHRAARASFAHPPPWEAPRSRLAPRGTIASPARPLARRMRARRALGPRVAPLFPAWAPAHLAQPVSSAPLLQRWRPPRAPRARSERARARWPFQAAPRARGAASARSRPRRSRRALQDSSAPLARAPARRALLATASL
jgi:hypothetical protein